MAYTWLMIHQTNPVLSKVFALDAEIMVVSFNQKYRLHVH